MMERKDRVRSDKAENTKVENVKAEKVRAENIRGISLLTWRPSVRLLALLSVTGMVMLLIPLYYISRYSIPFYDDYIVGVWTRSVPEAGGSLWELLKIAYVHTRTTWYAWSGLYASEYMMSLVPLIWGEDHYYIGALILLTLIVAGIWCLVHVLIRCGLKCTEKYALIYSSLLSAMATVLIYTCCSAFYWWDAGINYVGIHGIALAYVGLCVLVLQSRQWTRLVMLALAAIPGAVVAGGGNFVTALQIIATVASLAGLAFLLKRFRQGIVLSLIFLMNLAALYLNVSAPGNAVRAQSFVGWGKGPIEAILLSLVAGLRYIWSFTGWITLVLLALMTPIGLHMVRETRFTFPFPALVTAWSYGIYCAGFTANYYAQGHEGVSRCLNTVKITFQILLILNQVYWLGWCCRRKNKTHLPAQAGQPAPWWFYGIIVGLGLLIFKMEPNPIGTYSTYGAYYYIHTGEAYNFYQEYLERVEILKGPETNVVLEPYHWMPWLLINKDITENPEDEINTSMAGWYYKESVRLGKR